MQDHSREDRGNRSLRLCGHSDVVGCIEGSLSAAGSLSPRAIGKRL